MSWQLGSLALLALALGAGFAWYERSHPTARVLALVGTLAALAALGRIAFAPLPNVKPTTDIVLISGYALGGAPGFAVGAVTALASNLFFGQGYWTPWQMLGWGLVGVGGAALARVLGPRPGRVALAAACGIAGLAYGALLNLSTWVTFSGSHTAGEYVAIAGAAVWFDVAHALGNVAFALAFGPALLRAVARFRARFEVTWAPVAAAVLAVAAIAPLTAEPPAAAASVQRSAAFLARAQNSDGGFGPAPGARSTTMHTAWAALGLAAARRSPRAVRRRGRSPIDYLRAHARGIRDAGDLERTILALDAAGVSPRRFAGRDLVAELLRRRGRNGSFGRLVNLTSFGVLALRASGVPARSRYVRAAARWLARTQNRDGGFNFAGRGGASGIDDTAAPVQALAAAGWRGSRTLARAVRFLRRAQNLDGGFPLARGGASNAQSTAWAVQAFLAAGVEPERVRRRGSRSPIAYLRSLMAADGSVRYSRTSRQTPVWVTAQALMALARRPFR